MTSQLESRAAALRDLIALRLPVEEAVAAIRRFPWDCDEPLATLTCSDALNALGQYLRGDLPPAALTAWAEALESREDVGLEETYLAVLTRLLFELANPDIVEPLSPAVANRWADRLRSNR